MPARLRAAATTDHAVDLLRRGHRPIAYATDVVASYAVLHLTSVSLRGDTPTDWREREPAEDGVGWTWAECQMWVPRWTWVVAHALGVMRKLSVRRVAEDPELQAAVLSAYDLGGAPAARALLLQGSFSYTPDAG